MNTRKRFLLFSLLALALAGEAGPGVAQTHIVERQLPGYGKVEYVEGEVLIRFRETISLQEQSRLKDQMDVRQSRSFRTAPLTHIKMQQATVEQMLELYRGHPQVESIQPNYVYRRIEPVERVSFAGGPAALQSEQEAVEPDDEFFRNQWALKNEGQTFARLVDEDEETVEEFSGTAGADISATHAWAETTGSQEVIVAVFDSGIDYTHPDLAGNLFQDGQGRFGVDCSPQALEQNDGECGDEPMDTDGHGTHVTGIIGAVGDNGAFIAGVNWNVRLMAVRIFDDDNGTSTAAILAGYDYALEQGALISNHSYGFRSDRPEEEVDPAMRTAIEQAGQAGHLVVAAAGNDESNNDIGFKTYPASYDLDNIISVAATDEHDELAGFSNFGPESVHIAAPGNLIISTDLPHEVGGEERRYSFRSGTSMAVPHVTGVVGLMKARFPLESYDLLRHRILTQSDPLESLEGLIQRSGRLNAHWPLLLEDDGVPPETITDLEVADSGQKFIFLQWTAPGNGSGGRVSSYDIRISDEPLDEENFEQANRVDKTVIPKDPGALQELLIRQVGDFIEFKPGQTLYLAIRSEDVFANRSEVSNPVESAMQLPPLAEVNLVDNDEGFTVNLDQTGDTRSHALQITNAGSGPLRVNSPGRFAPPTIFEESERFFPYEVTTNLMEMAPAFDWVDAGEVGEFLDFTDLVAGVQNVDLPFSFPFFGGQKDSVYVSVNGFLTFQPVIDPQATNRNRNVPSQIGPADLIAVHWADLAMTRARSILTYHDEGKDRFIITWSGMTRNPASDFGNLNITFQVILHKGGAITMQYAGIDNTLRSLTAGLNGPDGRSGALFSYNDGRLEEGLAVTFTPAQPDWLEMEGQQLVLQPGETRQIDFTVDAAALPPDSYFSELFLLTNDLDRGGIKIPVVADVGGELARMQLYHASVDPEIDRFDLFVNGKMFKPEVEFNTRSGWVDVPAALDLEVLIFSENAESVADPAVVRTVQFPAGKDLLVIAAGMSDPSLALMSVSATQEFDFYMSELEEKDVPGDKARLIFFNGIADVDMVGLHGFYRVESPPFVLSEGLPFGTFTAGQTIVARDFDLDVSEGPTLHESFAMDIAGEGGETVLVVVTGYADATDLQPDLKTLFSIGAGRGVEAGLAAAPPGARHVPDRFELEENFPNPFYPVTQIQFTLPEQRDVRIEIYDGLGRRVQTLLDEQRQQGIHRVEFDGSGLASGAYLYRIMAGSEVLTGKMMLIK